MSVNATEYGYNTLYYTAAEDKITVSDHRSAAYSVRG